MSYTLTLPDDIYRALQRYADQQQQTPEEALVALLESICVTNGNAPAVTAPEDQAGANGAETAGEYLDPWEGFYGAFESKYPDLTERHDYYIGQAALETHEDDDPSS